MAQWKKALDINPNLTFILETQDGRGTSVHEHIHISTHPLPHKRGINVFKFFKRKYTNIKLLTCYSLRGPLAFKINTIGHLWILLSFKHFMTFFCFFSYWHWYNSDRSNSEFVPSICLLQLMVINYKLALLKMLNIHLYSGIPFFISYSISERLEVVLPQSSSNNSVFLFILACDSDLNATFYKHCLINLI